MAEQGRTRQSMTHTPQPVPEDDKLRKTPPSTEPQFIKDMDTPRQVSALVAKESDPVVAEVQTDSTVKHMQTVFTAMKKHFDNARKEALSLPNSDEMAAMLAHLNMAEVAMDVMVSHAEGSLV